MGNFKYILSTNNTVYAAFVSKKLADTYKIQQEEELDFNGMDIPEWEIREIADICDHIPSGTEVEAYYKNGEIVAISPIENDEIIDFGYLCFYAENPKTKEFPNEDLTVIMRME